MLRANIILAIAFAILLISLTSWQRFSGESAAKANLIAVNTVNDSTYNDLRRVGSASAEAAPTISPEPMSETDMISRQLFSDYLKLSSQSQVLPTNLENLGESYADGILSLAPLVKTVEMNDIKTTADSEEGLYKYSFKMVQVRAKYAALVKAKSSVGSAFDGTNSAALSNFMSSASKLYLDAAQELKAIEVPASLAQNHLELIQVYLENSEAMKAIADVSNNPVKVYGAIKTQTENAQKEESLFLNIQLALMANGITNGYE